VIETHWLKVIDAYDKPEAHEIPCEDVSLTGKNFEVPVNQDLSLPDFDLAGRSSILTGAYVPLGTTTTSGLTIPGETPCNGAFLRAESDGSDLNVVAWGLRSDFGYRFNNEGQLIATQNSANPMKPRGLHDDWESIYLIEEGAWYGWPDFYSGVPITDPRFAVPDAERSFVLTPETHARLLRGRDAPPAPLMRLEPHVALEGFVFGRKELGLEADDMLVAEMGTVVTHRRDKLPGFRVQRVNPRTGEVEDFLVNKSGKPASATGGEGLERPIQLEYGPDGTLYVVDFGVIELKENELKAHPQTATVWRVQYNGAQASPSSPKAPGESKGSKGG
jgi:glucose/arabinose dehydrogenase